MSCGNMKLKKEMKAIIEVGRQAELKSDCIIDEIFKVAIIVTKRL